MDVRSPGSKALAVAAATHALVVAAIALTRTPAPVAQLPDDVPTVDLDLSPPPAPTGALAPRDVPTATGASAQTPAAGRALGATGPAAAGGGGATELATDPATGVGGVEVAAAPAATSTAERTGPSGAPVPLSLGQLGVGGPNRFLGTPRGERETPAEKSARDVERSMAQARADHDRGVGLGPEGPLLGELESTIYASSIDLNGKAAFDATYDAAGALTGLVVVTTDGDRRGWETIASAVRGRLAGKPGRAVGGRGMVSRIEVDTALKMPSGRDPGLEVDVGGLPVKKAPPTSKRPTKVTLLDPIPKLVTVPLDREGTIKVPVPQVGITVLGVDGDPVDIAATARRVVHAKVASQRAL